jgi:hypothetical protein
VPETVLERLGGQVPYDGLEIMRNGQRRKLDEKGRCTFVEEKLEKSGEQE